MSEISRLNFINIYACEFDEPAILASKRLLTVSKQVDYKNNIDLLKESMAGPNSSDLESTNQIIFKTK